jgi:hypothetical protein
MKSNTFTKINIFFWNNFNYYFYCFKKAKVDEDEMNNLLNVQTIIIYDE